MSIMNYSANINAIKVEESAKILILTVKYLYGKQLQYDKCCSLIEKYYEEAAQDVEAYKEKYSRYYNAFVDKLYRQISEILEEDNRDIILYVKSTVCRFYDWFLYSDKELSNLQDQLPYVLNNDIQIYKNYENKQDIFAQHDNNIIHINNFLGYESELDFADVTKRSDQLFLKLLGSAPISIRRDLDKAKREGGLYSRTTNKSAPFYKEVPIVTNSYIENLYSYESNMEYAKYLRLSRKFDTVRLSGNYDYITYNIIKNKALGTRFVFFTNPQINGFLKPIEDIFKKHLKSIKQIGTYDQDEAIKRTMDVINSNINRDISILCLDASKYSDTLPVSVINHVLKLIIKDENLVNAICESLNLPVLYKGNIIEHNATLQGIYFDFTAITLVNLYLQCAIATYTKSELIWTNVVGDDCITILTGPDHSEKALKGREILAHYGITVKESKAESSNLVEGKITYLKYSAQTMNREIVNISGLSPGLLLKNVHSYARLGAVIAYLKKSRYIERSDIPTTLLNNYHRLFSETIYSANMSKIHRIKSEDAAFIRDNAVKLMMERPFIFGGYKYYDLTSNLSLESIEDYIEDACRFIEYNFIDESDTTIPLIMKIKEDNDLEATSLDSDLNIFISEEFNEMHSKLISFRKAIKSGINLTEQDIRDIRSIVSNLGDRRFDKYIPGGLTTDRITQQPFEDKMLLAPTQKPIDIEAMMYLPMPTDIESKNMTIIVTRWLSSRGASIRGSNSINPYNGSLFIDINSNKIITFSGSDTGKYITVPTWIAQMRNYRNHFPEQWDEEMGKVFGAILNDIGHDQQVIKMVQSDPDRLYHILSIIHKANSTYRNRKEAIDNYVKEFKSNFVRDYKNKLVKELLNKYRDSFA